MDKETVLKIIEELEARINEKYEDPLTQVSEYFELILFKEYLWKVYYQEYNELEISKAKGV